jgi:DNA modification methylase
MKVMDQATGERWAAYNGDSAELLRGLPDGSIDLAVFSPPFQALYVYSPTERDLGNSRTPAEFFAHLGYITAELGRIMRPGRNVAVHCAQITAQKVLDGWIGLKDFRGALIEHFGSHGFHYHGEVCIDKDPQAQAIRTHAKGLLFVQKRKDSSWLRPALADYVLVFRTPGENDVPVQTDISDNEWIEWARPVWYGIRETDTLQAPPKKNDERHVAPLQLGVIERCIRLWSNRGETVLDPFAGIGSTGYEAIRLGRRFVGVELKPEYFEAMRTNLRAAEELAEAPSLFEGAPMNRAARREMGVRSTGIHQRVQFTRLPDSPPPGGPHQWIVAAMWKLSDEEARHQATGSGGEVHLSADNLLSIEGPGCWVCERVWTPAIADQPCTGEP